MYLLEAVYPLAVGGANVALGWVLYHLSEPVFGGLLVLIGLAVILTQIGSVVSDCRGKFENSA
jgi:hypothetical protein